MNVPIHKIKRYVGWFVLLGTAVIVLMLFLASLRSDLFSKTFDIHFKPDSAVSFHIGQSVYLRGFVIGRIQDIRLQGDGHVVIELRLLDRYRSMIHQDAYLYLFQSGLFGEQILEIDAGSLDKPLILPQQQLRYKAAASLEQVLLDLRPMIAHGDDLLQQLSRLTQWLNQPDQDFRQALAHLNHLGSSVDVDEIETMMHTANTVLKQMQRLGKQLDDEQLAAQLSLSVQSATRVFKQLEILSRSLAERAPNSIDHIDRLSEHMSTLSQSLQDVAKDMKLMTPELPQLVEESTLAIENMQEVLEQMRQSWLLGGSSSGPSDTKSLLVRP